MAEVFILLILIFVNGLFVMGEIALVSARRSKLESLANKGDEKARKALDLVENPEKFLSTAQIGITLIAILTGVYSGEKFGSNLVPFFQRFSLTEPYADTIATTIIVILVTFLSILFGELIPKKIGLLKAEKIARLVAGPMNFLSRIVHPLVWFLSKITQIIFKIFNIRKADDSSITEEEIKAMITEGSEHGTIEEDEKEIIERVFHLSDRNITSLMTHRTDMVWVDLQSTVHEVLTEFSEIIYSTYPACEGSIDNVKGLVYVKDMLKASPETRMEQIVKPAIFVPENNTPYQVLEKFKATKIHTCFVVNEYGTMEGMITLNDIMEAIIGDVPQTGQDEYEIIKRHDGSFLVDAQITFYDFLSYFDVTEWLENQETDFDTVAGFTLNQLEHIPATGETFEWKGIRFEIMDMDGQRIDKILVNIPDEIRDKMEED